ncbi:hypothetical protein, partial [Campylobacter fetus]|uniref:hypothetical protein n=1 Tax=Campylobacter fetus TaxID=196 RepID=UPI0005562A7C
MWVDSKTAAGVLEVSNKSVEKACLRATKANKKICKIKSHICNFIYVDGIGRGGKTLQIWLDKIPAKENSNEFLAGIWECDPNEAKENSNEFLAGIWECDPNEAKENSNEFLAGIWECDPNEAKENSNEAEIWSNKATKDTKGESSESFSDTRTSRAFEKQGLQGGSLCRAWQGEDKSSKDRQGESMYKAVANKSATSYSTKVPASGVPHKSSQNSTTGVINNEKYSKTSYETQEERLDKSSQNSAITDIRALKVQGSPYAVGTSVFANFSGGLATTLKVHKEKETINDKENKANLQEIRNPH